MSVDGRGGGCQVGMSAWLLWSAGIAIIAASKCQSCAITAIAVGQPISKTVRACRTTKA